MSAMAPQKTIRVPVSPESNGDSNGPVKLSYLVTGLEHFTEYLFLISACHEPHDEYGNPLPCVSSFKLGRLSLVSWLKDHGLVFTDIFQCCLTPRLYLTGCSAFKFSLFYARSEAFAGSGIVWKL